MDCEHVFAPYMPGWRIDERGDLSREYVCRLCGEAALFGPGDYPNAHLWPS